MIIFLMVKRFVLMVKRWTNKERSNSELWAATPKTVNILYLEQHERKESTTQTLETNKL